MQHFNHFVLHFRYPMVLNNRVMHEAICTSLITTINKRAGMILGQVRPHFRTRHHCSRFVSDRLLSIDDDKTSGRAHPIGTRACCSIVILVTYSNLIITISSAASIHLHSVANDEHGSTYHQLASGCFAPAGPAEKQAFRDFK